MSSNKESTKHSAWPKMSTRRIASVITAIVPEIKVHPPPRALCFEGFCLPNCHLIISPPFFINQMWLLIRAPEVTGVTALSCCHSRQKRSHVAFRAPSSPCPWVIMRFPLGSVHMKKEVPVALLVSPGTLTSPGPQVGSVYPSAHEILGCRLCISPLQNQSRADSFEE